MQENSIIIYPFKNPLSGKIDIPGDKSISHRALMISSICSNKVRIYNSSMCQDVLTTKNILVKLGINIQSKKNFFEVFGKGLYGFIKPNYYLNSENSATSVRLLCGLLVKRNFNTIIYGDKSLSNRPMNRIIHPLRYGRAKLYGKNDYLPIFIRKNTIFKNMTYKIPIPSAQVKSSLILSSFYSNKIIRIYEKYKTRDHTENILKYFSRNIYCKNNYIIIKNNNKKIFGKDLYIPNDISSAAYYIVTAILKKDSYIIMKNMCLNNRRAYFIKILKRMGAIILYKNRKIVCEELVGDIHVYYTKNLNVVKVYESEVPLLIDELPILFLLSAYLKQSMEFYGIKELSKKESNRVYYMHIGLKNIGIKNIITKDFNKIIIFPSNIRTGIVDCNFDHRISMTFVIASIISGKNIILKNFNINISFPNFIKIFEKFGGKYTKKN